MLVAPNEPAPPLPPATAAVIVSLIVTAVPVIQFDAESPTAPTTHTFGVGSVAPV